MTGMTEQQVDDFCAKLKDFQETLPEEQKSLLAAILRIAWQAGTKDDALADGFDGCFTPDQADLILAYDSGQTDVVLGIIRGALIRGTPSSIIQG